MPSCLSSSVSSTSRATVSDPSLETSHPGISSLMISTSANSTDRLLPSTMMPMVPFFSSSAICSCDKASIWAATPFISLPNFLPIVLKLHFTFLTRIPCPSTNFSSLTLTSLKIRSLTASMYRFCSSVAGTMMLCRGWRTLMFTLRRRARTIEVIFWAISIRASRSLSIRLSSVTGNVSRWTLSISPPKSL